MNKKFIPVTAGLALAGCATTPKPSVVVQKVYCLTPEQLKKVIDARPGSIIPSLNGQAQHDFIVSANQNILLGQYADGMLVLLSGCTGQLPPSA